MSPTRRRPRSASRPEAPLEGALEEFCALLARELRDPLGAIRTALQVMDHAGASPEEAARQRAIIDRQVRQLAHFADDLLDVAHVLSGRIEIDPRRVDLNETARRSVAALRDDTRMQEHDVSLAVQAEPVEVWGDGARLEQILFNLLDNALKYTPAGGRVEVTVDREDGQGVIRVRDTGMGMAPEMLPHVFELFLEATASHPRAGLGLGLTLVRRLAELHGGRVSATSEGVGRGSEFVVSLPLMAPAAVAGGSAESVSAAPTLPRRVLVVEDNPDARDALRALLEVWGYQVEVAEDGPRGFEMAVARPPDVVVVDIALPGLDGYHVAHGLRAALGAHGVFLVALTGHGQPDDRRRALEAGFDLHLVKPVDLQVLAQALASAPQRGELA
jgi:CheY-like chemotaxis protein